MSDHINRKEITARLDSDLYEQLRVATFNLRISKQQAITDALRMWLRSTSGNGAGHRLPLGGHIIPADMVPVVNWLVRLWERGTPEQESLKSSLKTLAAGREIRRKGHSKSAP